MLVKRNKLKRFISGLLALTMLLGQVPITAFADNQEELTIDSVYSNQEVLSQSYYYNGEKKTIYAYNTGDGRSRITGDIIFRIGSDKYTDVRNIDGYIEIPYNIKQIDVCQVNDTIAGPSLDLYFLTDTELLLTFTELDNDGYDSQYNYYPVEVSYWGVKKLLECYMLDYDGNLKFGNNMSLTIDDNVKDFSLINNGVLRIEKTSGDIYYKNFKGLSYDWKKDIYANSNNVTSSFLLLDKSFL